MKVITHKEVLDNLDFYVDEIIKGKIFIYPTDTIYGIGCNAQNSFAVKKIRFIKKREEKPFSIIAPDKDWVITNAVVDSNTLLSLSKLPGAYTFILKLKNRLAIAKSETIGKMENIGIRIPNNWFAKIISKSQVPFVTTSVNISGEEHISEISELKEEIRDKVDYIIDDGKLDGKPSTIIDLTSGNEKVLRK